MGNMKKICEKEKSNSSDRRQIYEQIVASKESRRASNLCTNQKRQTLHELGNVRNTKRVAVARANEDPRAHQEGMDDGWIENTFSLGSISLAKHDI